MDGLDLLQKFKAAKPDLYVVMGTGYADKDKVKIAIESGANGYIVNPFSYNQFEASIKRFVEHIKANGVNNGPLEEIDLEQFGVAPSKPSTKETEESKEEKEGEASKEESSEEGEEGDKSPEAKEEAPKEDEDKKEENSLLTLGTICAKTTPQHFKFGLGWLR